MPNPIQKIAVIGSGVMGSQIAAHATNAGVPVLLLDIIPANTTDRNALAKGAVERLLKTEPAPFMHPKNAKLIEVGNLEDDLYKLKDCDWIIEAVLENPQVKSDLYKRVDAARKVGSIVSSNTSTIPLATLIQDQTETFAADFLITHFFNPPRYMRLMELVTGAKTRPDAVNVIRDFCDVRLGKGVVPCHDTPGFIANRLGTFFMQAAVDAAFDLELTVEEADAVCGKPFGMPKTGVFGLIDLIGVDLMPHIAESFLATLPADDAYRAIYRKPPLFDRMIEDGYTGRKGKGGFYRLTKTDSGKLKESINLKTGEYAQSQKPALDVVDAAKGDLRALCGASDKIGKFAWQVLSQTLSYAAELAAQIADDITVVDTAMRLGYNWKFGPFELIDKLGASWLAARLSGENRAVPHLLKMAAEKSFYRVENGRLEYLQYSGVYAPIERPVGVLVLADVKRAGTALIENASGSLWDIGDGVLCLEFQTKMNIIDSDALVLLHKSIAFIAGDNFKYDGKWKGLVIHSEAKNFSVGANLGQMLFSLENGMYHDIEEFMKSGQDTYQYLRFAPFPSVAAPHGLALGGGCEITLNCSAVQAHAETYMGLVEAGVGLVPGWGGCAQMLGRAFAKRHMIPPVSQVFETISLAKVSKSAQDAEELHYMRATDGVTMNRDRLLYDARQKVIELSRDYQPPERLKLNLPGPAGRAALDLVLEGFRMLGKLTPHDVVVARSLAAILCGGEHGLVDLVTEEQILALERREMMQLFHNPATAARIAHMLKTGKPLRN